jgi:urea transporter
MKGSAQVFVFINPSTGDEELNSIQVVAPVIIMPEAPGSQAALFRHLLELNAKDLVHGSYGVDGDDVVLSDALELENLDFNEFQASFDSLTVALASHLSTLAPFRAA